MYPPLGHTVGVNTHSSRGSMRQRQGRSVVKLRFPDPTHRESGPFTAAAHIFHSSIRFDIRCCEGGCGMPFVGCGQAPPQHHKSYYQRTCRPKFYLDASQGQRKEGIVEPDSRSVGRLRPALRTYAVVPPTVRVRALDDVHVCCDALDRPALEAMSTAAAARFGDRWRAGCV